MVDKMVAADKESMDQLVLKLRIVEGVDAQSKVTSTSWITSGWSA